MNQQKAYLLFEQMISVADNELLNFTLHHPCNAQLKVDKSVVTDCDKAIDIKLSEIAKGAGLQVISEEGMHSQAIVESGNYMTIDPIDGTLGYIDYVNNALSQKNINSFLKKDFGAEHDFSLLLSIVEHGVPEYAAVYNYVTHEKILIDGNKKENLIRVNNKRDYSGAYAVYCDQRPGGKLEDSLKKLFDVTIISQATLGLKSVYTIINPHKSAITAHLIQNAGIWDVIPAAVAARAFGGNVYDSRGDLLSYTSYIVLPKIGAIVLRGERFQFILKDFQ